MSSALDRLNDPFQTAPAATVTLPMVLTGQVDSGASSPVGSGFSVNHSGTGTYVITFTTVFAAAPTVVATLADSGAGVIHSTSVSASAVTITTTNNSNVATDRAFNFIAYQTA